MRNVGTPDRIIRLVFGARSMMAAHVTGGPLFASAVAGGSSVVVGALLTPTAVFSFCRIYAGLRPRIRPRS